MNQTPKFCSICQNAFLGPLCNPLLARVQEALGIATGVLTEIVVVLGMTGVISHQATVLKKGTGSQVYFSNAACQMPMLAMVILEVLFFMTTGLADVTHFIIIQVFTKYVL